MFWVVDTQATFHDEAERKILRCDGQWPQYLVLLGLALLVNLWLSSKFAVGLYPLLFACVTVVIALAGLILVLRDPSASPVVGCIGAPLMCVLTLVLIVSGTPTAARVFLSRSALHDAALDALADETSETSILPRPVVGQVGRLNFDIAKRCGERVVFATGDGWVVEGLVSSPSSSWQGAGSIEWDEWTALESAIEIRCSSFE